MRRIENRIEVPGTPEQVWEADRHRPRDRGVVRARRGRAARRRPGRDRHRDAGWRSAARSAPGSRRTASPTRRRGRGQLASRVPGRGAVRRHVRRAARQHACTPTATTGTRCSRTCDSGWDGFLLILRLHCTHFAGRACTTIFASATSDDPAPRAFAGLVRRLGIERATVRERIRTAELAGVVEHRAEQELIARLDEPAPASRCCSRTRWASRSARSCTSTSTGRSIPARRSGGATGCGGTLGRVSEGASRSRSPPRWSSRRGRPREPRHRVRAGRAQHGPRRRNVTAGFRSLRKGEVPRVHRAARGRPPPRDRPHGRQRQAARRQRDRVDALRLLGDGHVADRGRGLRDRRRCRAVPLTRSRRCSAATTPRAGSRPTSSSGGSTSRSAPAPHDALAGLPPLDAPAPSAAAGAAATASPAPPSPTWVPTKERFIDPSTQRVMRVWVDPADHQRHYVADA